MIAEAERQFAELKERRAGDGDLPPGPVQDSAPADLRSLPEGVFDPSTLFTAESPAQEFPMPTGGVVWVHPASFLEAKWIAAQAWSMVKPAVDAKKLTDRADIEEACLWWGRVFQAVIVSRVAADPASARVFAPDLKSARAYARVFAQNARWREPVQQIVQISDALAGDGGVLTGVMRDFFGAMETLLTTCVSLLSTGSMTSCVETLTAFASYVSLIRRRGTCSVSELRALIPEPDPLEEPPQEN